MARHAPPGVERVEAELARCWLRLRRWFSRARRADDGRGLQALRLSVRPPGDSLEAEHVVGVGEGDQLAQEDLEEVGGRGHRQRRTGTGCHVGGVADVGGGDRDRPNRDERGDAGGVAKSGVTGVDRPGLATRSYGIPTIERHCAATEFGATDAYNKTAGTPTPAFGEAPTVVVVAAGSVRFSVLGACAATACALSGKFTICVFENSLVTSAASGTSGVR